MEYGVWRVGYGVYTSKELLSFDGQYLLEGEEEEVGRGRGGEEVGRGRSREREGRRGRV